MIDLVNYGSLVGVVTAAFLIGVSQVSLFFSWVECFGYLLLDYPVISVSYIIFMLSLLLMPLASLHFCVGLDFVTPTL
jgi:hypothetical protein